MNNQVYTTSYSSVYRKKIAAEQVEAIIVAG